MVCWREEGGRNEALTEVGGVWVLPWGGQTAQGGGACRLEEAHGPFGVASPFQDQGASGREKEQLSQAVKVQRLNHACTKYGFAKGG